MNANKNSNKQKILVIIDMGPKMAQFNDHDHNVNYRSPIFKYSNRINIIRQFNNVLKKM